MKSCETVTPHPDVANPNPFDICECGDYRRDHDGPEHRGRCGLNAISHGIPAPYPGNVCARFRFSTCGYSPDDYRKEFGRRQKP